MSPVTIRPYKPEDLQKLVEIDIREQRAYVGPKWDYIRKSEQDAKLVTKSKALISSRQGVHLVALTSREIIGFLLAVRILALGSLRVEYIVIDKKYQKQGVATMLYKELFTYAEKKHIKRIEALINTDNPKSIELHKKVGFDLRNRVEAVYSAGG